MPNLKRFFEDKGAVSPVIGVVLIVAITAILAGIVGIHTVDMTENKLASSTDLMSRTPHVSLNLSAGDLVNTDGTVHIEHLGGIPLNFAAPTAEIVAYEGDIEATVTQTIGELNVGHKDSFMVSNVKSGDSINIKIIDVPTHQILYEDIVEF